MISDFENGIYHLKIYGPNGFYREFSGIEADPLLQVKALYEKIGNRPTGKLSLQFINLEEQAQVVSITDNAYQSASRTLTIGKAGTAKEMIRITLATQKSFGWYDFTVSLKNNASFGRRYAGRIETGEASKTDPFMGRVI